jgi:excinuclease ABC subunit C
MKSENIKKKISKLPDNPGVYFFLKGKKILYIGKATSLKDRVKSYFNGRIEETRGPLISKMLGEFTDIKFQKTDSVLEALILEAHLIKKHQPEANILEKDDRSFNYVVITKEDFPRVLIVRGRELEKNVSKNNFSVANSFGPFTNGTQLKEAMKIVRRLFPFRDKCDLPTRQIVSKKMFTGGKNIFSTKPNQNKPCFNRQIGLCPGVCTGEISKEDYKKQIKKIVLFFEGNKTKLINSLKKEMKGLAKKHEFEKADKIKKQIFALYHIQDISLIKSEKAVSKNADKIFRIESYDIAHLSGTNMVGAMVVVENGKVKKSDYRKFKIRGQTGADDTKALAEILTRRLAHDEWSLPNLVVVDGGIAQKRAAEKILKDRELKIPVLSVVKDEKHRPREILFNLSDKKLRFDYETEILLANAEAHRFTIGFHKHLRRKFL